MSRQIDPFPIRLDPELRAKVEQAAAANRRSLNSEIVQKLADAYGEPMNKRHDDPQFLLRIPQELRDQLDAAASQNQRSTTAEILFRLQSTFSPPAAPADQLTPEEIVEVRELLARSRPVRCYVVNAGPAESTGK